MNYTMPTVCHFCGSKVTIFSDGSECKADDGSWIGFQCGTSWYKDYHKLSQLQSRRCEIAERDTLRYRIKRLEEAGDKIAYWFEAREQRHFDALESWRKAKEAKP